MGCGTGLAGPYLKPWTKQLSGIDCSQNMLMLANKTELYDHLIEGFIPDLPWPKAVDVFFLADCFPYIGDLSTTIRKMVLALNENGLIVCSIESGDDQTGTYELSKSGRFKHSKNYLVTLMTTNGCKQINYEKTNIRYEQHNPVNNELFIFKKIS